MDDLKIQMATMKDEKQIRQLLAAAGLPYDDIHTHLHNFLVARQDDAMVGAVGLEIYGELGLLRSLVVASSSQGNGVGRMLFDTIMAYARMRRVRALYLLTTTADRFFGKLGFTVVDRNKLPEAIRKTNEFLKLCPTNAVCMTRRIDDEIFYMAKELVDLAPKMPGVKMWAVALDKAMFTYFDIEPETRFERHKHESEQITFILEGEFFFEIADKTICLEPGAVIAIPSNAPHAAYTKGKRVIAVDAWSPIRHEYLHEERS